MTGQQFEKLVEIMATLRGPNGCPWDKQQDFNSLKPMLVEEVYEVLEAVEMEDSPPKPQRSAAAGITANHAWASAGCDTRWPAATVICLDVSC